MTLVPKGKQPRFVNRPGSLARDDQQTIDLLLFDVAYALPVCGSVPDVRAARSHSPEHTRSHEVYRLAMLTQPLAEKYTRYRGKVEAGVLGLETTPDGVAWRSCEHVFAGPVTQAATGSINATECFSCIRLAEEWHWAFLPGRPAFQSTGAFWADAGACPFAGMTTATSVAGVKARNQ
jgi:hypothetical protein